MFSGSHSLIHQTFIHTCFMPGIMLAAGKVGVGGQLAKQTNVVLIEQRPHLEADTDTIT